MEAHAALIVISEEMPMTRSRPSLFAVSGVALIAALVAGSGVVSADTQSYTAPNPRGFVRKINNPYMPLVPGTIYTYEGTSDGASVLNTVKVLSSKKVILGIPCVVVEDTVWEDGELVEKTYDWYVQDTEGNVWYMGEDSSSYRHGIVVSKHGSWQAGVDGAHAGIIMEADPQVGDTYQQEYYPGVAEDMAQVLALDESVSVAYGDFDGVLLTKEWSPLEPDVIEHKYYADGIGLVYSEAVAGEQETMELVDITYPRRHIWR
jgi:hypothetical protein